MGPWPFWAATSDERIDTAFELADLRPGERLLDLGCGDGRVLLRAAVLRGARVRGVEMDAGLAGDARALLASSAVAGEVLEEDLFTTELSSDVVFCYLSPATLQRLRPRLERLPAGTRVVTTGYAVPGWEPDVVASRCYLYRLPATPVPTDRSRRGWDAAGLLLAVRPETRSLVATTLHHAGGDVRVLASGDLDTAGIRTGSDVASPGEAIVVDISLEPRPRGDALAGRLEAPGHGHLEVVVAVDDGDPAMWRLDPHQVGRLIEAVGRGEVATAVRGARAAR